MVQTVPPPLQRLIYPRVLQILTASTFGKPSTSVSTSLLASTSPYFFPSVLGSSSNIVTASLSISAWALASTSSDRGLAAVSIGVLVYMLISLSSNVSACTSVSVSETMSTSALAYTSRTL